MHLGTDLGTSGEKAVLTGPTARRWHALDGPAMPI
jgi:hypothetical protein